MSESDVATSAVAIVTAAGEGIGEATAHAFADAGYDLALDCARENKLWLPMLQ